MIKKLDLPSAMRTGWPLVRHSGERQPALTPVLRRWGGLVLVLLWVGTAGIHARDTMSDTWVATDGLGRTVPGNSVVGAPRTNKFVGIFYFLWLDRQRPGPYDCTKIIAQGMASGNTDYNTYNWGAQSAFHFWGEPYYGYYRADDPYILRRHAQMLTDAGIDVLIFDVTNALTYQNVYLALCQVFMDIRATGRTTPQIAFIAHSNSDTTVTKLYNDFYNNPAYAQYQPLWFRWQGKPLICAAPGSLSAPITNFFTFRESWAWTTSGGWFGTGQDKWPWLKRIMPP